MSTPRAYYNDVDPKVCAWARQLIRDGLVMDGEVDERPIEQVRPEDLDGFTQCHFFCGILGWPLALRLAGWPDDRPVWTGSCPCQDFSHCGKQAKFEGDRDLWPTWFSLIRERMPDELFGEQVDDSPEWYDRTANDLEDIGYAIAPSIIPAYSVGTPQERSRLFFVAHTAQGNGYARDRMVSSRDGGSSAQLGRLPRLSVAGRWWSTDEGGERLPTLVRNFDGLSALLGGFGNAIVPHVAAQFISAYLDVLAERGPA